MDRFWRWAQNEAPEKPDTDTGLEGNNETMPAEAPPGRTLYLDGTIASESWFDDDVTPAVFAEELNAGEGDITVWIDSPGGDCFAAARIYNMLRDYKGRVTVKVDGIAASAASVVAMAGDTVLVSPVSMLMIHNPATIAMGDHVEMEKAIAMLDEVKNSIINAYQAKTGLSRGKLSQMMEDETWMNARRAVELGFADGVIERDPGYASDERLAASDSLLFARKPFVQRVTNLLNERFHATDAGADTAGEADGQPDTQAADPPAEQSTDPPAETSNDTSTGQSAGTPAGAEPHPIIAADLYDRLRTIKNHF